MRFQRVFSTSNRKHYYLTNHQGFPASRSRVVIRLAQNTKAKPNANTRTLRPDKCLVVKSLDSSLRPVSPSQHGIQRHHHQGVEAREGRPLLRCQFWLSAAAEWGEIRRCFYSLSAAARGGLIFPFNRWPCLPPLPGRACAILPPAASGQG